MTLTCGLLEAPWVDVSSLNLRKNIFQRMGGQILDHEAVGSPSLETLRAQLDQVLRNPVWLAQLCSGGDLGHANVPPDQQYLGASVLCDHTVLNQAAPRTSTPRASPASPFNSPVLEAGEILNATTIQVTAFICLRDWLVLCERCTQNYCYYIIWGEMRA